MREIAKLHPGIRALADASAKRARALTAASDAAFYHDRFAEVALKSKSISFAAVGPRGGTGQGIETANETEFEIMFDACMEVLRRRVEAKIKIAEEMKDE